MNGGGAEGGRQLEVEQVGLSARLRERERGARETRGEGRGGWGGSGSSKQTDRQTHGKTEYRAAGPEADPSRSYSGWGWVSSKQTDRQTDRRQDRTSSCLAGSRSGPVRLAVKHRRRRCCAAVDCHPQLELWEGSRVPKYAACRRAAGPRTALRRW